MHQEDRASWKRGTIKTLGQRIRNNRKKDLGKGGGGGKIFCAKRQITNTIFCVLEGPQHQGGPAGEKREMAREYRAGERERLGPGSSRKGRINYHTEGKKLGV